MPACSRRKRRVLVHDEFKKLSGEVERRIALLQAMEESLGAELARAKDMAEAAGREGLEQVQSLKKELAKKPKTDDTLVQRLDELAAALPGIRERLQVLEDRPVARPTARQPAVPPRDPPRPTLPQDSGPDPVAVRAAVAKAMAQLASDDLAVLVLGIEGVRKNGVREAAPRLVEILHKSKHDFARQAAAAALGDLMVCDAVLPLAQALLDSSPAVAQQANRSVRQITGFDSSMSPTARIRERRRTRGAVIEWWRAHEDEVRLRLKQPKSK